MRIPLTRRTLVSSFLITSSLFRYAPGHTQQTAPPPAASLPHSIEVRDYRLFPGDDTRRFLVELYNTTDEPMDTPAVGVVLPHLEPEGNFGWATPMHQVLHPRSSAGLIGVAPASIQDDDAWGSPEWILCNEIESDKAEALAGWDVAFTHTLAVNAPNDIVGILNVSNHGDPLPPSVTILGLVRDEDDRICGGTVPIYLNSVQPGETRELKVRFGPTVLYIANPKDLINADEGVSIDFSLQPWSSAVNPGCSPVLPWNR